MSSSSKRLHRATTLRRVRVPHHTLDQRRTVIRQGADVIVRHDEIHHTPDDRSTNGSTFRGEHQSIGEHPTATVDEAARALKVCTATIYRAVRANQIPHVKCGRSVRIIVTW